MTEKPIILYDLPSQKPLAAWSLNPWKSTHHLSDPAFIRADQTAARLLLNYKGLNYKTAWTEYPDLQKVIGPQCVIVVFYSSRLHR